MEAQVSNDPEADVVEDDLVHFCLARAEDHCSHTGGGTDTGALFNGTTRNGAGSEDTLEDGRTFRGYGGGDGLVLSLKQPCDLTEIRTFAGHAGARASQNYTVLVAYAAAPDEFVKLTTGSKTSEGGATELRLPVKASGVVAVRFEFQGGAENVNVYREINFLGTASSKL